MKKRGILLTLAAGIVTLATVMAVLPAQAKALDPPKKPTFADVSGKDKDYFIAPDSPGYDYYYTRDPDVGRTLLTPNVVYLVNGTYDDPDTTEGIGITAYSAETGQVSAAWAQFYDDRKFGKTEPNPFGAVKGVCAPATGLTSAWVNFTNTTDKTKRWEKPTVNARRVVDGKTVLATSDIILSGTAKRITFNQSLLPGVYVVTVGSEAPFAQVELYIPRCGTTNPPKGDRGAGSTNAGKSLGSLKLVSCKAGKVRALLSNRLVQHDATYAITVKPKGGTARTATITVKTGEQKTYNRVPAKRGQVILKVLRGTQWVQLGKVTRPASC